MTKAKQVPLTERLREVPANLRIIVSSDDGKESTSHPVGHLCHEAAGALATQGAQKAEVSILLFTALRELHDAAVAVKADLDAVPPAGRPVCRNSRRLTWPLSTAAGALKAANEATIASISATPQKAEQQASPETTAEQFILAAIASSPQPLQDLGAHLSRWLDEDKWATAEALLLQLAIPQKAEQQASPQAQVVVKVTASGVQFGNSWYSHESITGYSADRLNSGACRLTAREYMKWVALAACGAQKAEQQASPQAQERGKYANVLTPFVAVMEAELHANSAKGDRPGWLTMSREVALLEIYWHAAKLSAAVKNNDKALIREHSADVANMAMMLLDVCGGLDVQAIPPSAPQAAPPAALSGLDESATKSGTSLGFDALRGLWNDSDLAQATPTAQAEPTGKTHVLKTDPEVFDAVAAGLKTHEIRRNDRDFRVGDALELRRTKYTGDQMHMRPEACPLEYTGEVERRVVSHVLKGYGLADGWVVLSFAEAGIKEKP